MESVLGPVRISLERVRHHFFDGFTCNTVGNMGSLVIPRPPRPPIGLWASFFCHHVDLVPCHHAVPGLDFALFL